MKAKSHCWWLSINRDLEQTAAGCKTCNVSPKEPSRITTAMAGATGPVVSLAPSLCWSFQKCNVLRARRRFFEAAQSFRMKSITTKDVLESLITRYGLRTQIVPDNGPQFTSTEFISFSLERGIKHLRTVPGHPRSNGQAQRYVDTFKKRWRAWRTEQLWKRFLEFFWHDIEAHRTAPLEKRHAKYFCAEKMKTMLDTMSQLFLLKSVQERNRKQSWQKSETLHFSARTAGSCKRSLNLEATSFGTRKTADTN